MRFLRPPRRRSALIVGLLLSTLILSGVLAFQAVTAAQYHRVTAETQLHDYARAASEETAARIAQDFEYYGFYPVFRILEGLGVWRPLAPLPDSAMLYAGAGDYERRALGVVQRLFRFDLATGRLEVAPSTEDANLHWLSDTLPQHVGNGYGEDWRSAVLIDPGPPQRLFVYTLRRTDSGLPITAYGFELNRDSTRALLDASVKREPVLPPSLLRGVPADSAIVVSLVDGSGQTLYQSHPDSVADGFVAVAGTDSRLGGLAARVALRGAVADRLIIGGLPSTRLPFTVGLLALTAAFIVIALLQLRREQELSRLRTEFVSNVSHELRTPLAQIRMFAETLLLGRVRSDEEQHRSLLIIDKEARRLTHLVENVLQFSRAERQVVSITPVPTDLAPLVREVLDLYAHTVNTDQVQFQAAIDATVKVNVDRGAVQQMLLNLLDNAVKYGPPRQTITVGLHAHDGRARLWVDDEGPGIPAADRARVWERFARLERERQSATAGTGIGLSVVHDLAVLHGARVWVAEAPGGGARFGIEFPGANTRDLREVPQQPPGTARWTVDQASVSAVDDV